MEFRPHPTFYGHNKFFVIDRFPALSVWRSAMALTSWRPPEQVERLEFPAAPLKMHDARCLAAGRSVGSAQRARSEYRPSSQIKMGRILFLCKSLLIGNQWFKKSIKNCNYWLFWLIVWFLEMTFSSLRCQRKLQLESVNSLLLLLFLIYIRKETK